MLTAAKATEAAKVLDVELNGLTSSVLSVAYRKAVMKHHPDQAENYDPVTWSKIVAAKKLLIQWIDSGRALPEPTTAAGDCRACGGTGRIKAQRGFAVLPMFCVMCNGAGSLIEREKEGSER